MSDNVNIIVQDTINEIVVNSAVIVETIDINVQVAVDEVTIIANPNEYIINVNRIIGEQVQSDWNVTDDQAPDYIKNKPTNTSDFINDGEDGVNPFITLEDIPPVTGFVPYTGATQDVNLGEFDITAAHLIKDGGQATQFLKADGSVDNNIYLTSADLPSTLDLYATTTASDVSGYTVLVRNISDSRFNTTAVDVSTGVITTTNQLVGSLVSDANIISGNPGIFNITTIGNISRTSGTGQAEFFFRVYKRDNLGVETFITESSKTLPVTNGGYVEFSAVALWNDGIFTDTDRVVLKYYADRLTSPVGSNPVYKFQFGGISPVRSTAAIPVAVLPNIYLRDLADVENVDALNNEVLYWNDADSLWEHSSVIDLLSPASSTVNGYLTSTDWTAFNGKFTLPALTSGSVLFSNGTTIAQKNSNFFWDNTNNRLGIGNAAPEVTLDVTGIGRFTSGARFNNVGIAYSLWGQNALEIGTNGNHFIIQATNGGNTSFGSVANLGAKVGIKAPGALSTDIALRVRNSADTGDLMSIDGTGVTSLGGRLVLNGNNLYIGGNNGNTVLRPSGNNIQLFNNNTGAYLFLNANGVVQLGPSSASNWATFSATGHTIYATTNTNFFSNGNVAIGTTTDQGGKLQVKAGGALSTDIALRVRNSADTGDLVTVNGLGVTTISTAISDNNNAPLVVQNLTPYSSPFNQFLQIWKNSAGSNILTLRADGSFQLAGTISSDRLTPGNNGNGTSVLTISRGNNGFWFPDGNKIGFNTNGSEKMRILDNGNLLINTKTDIASSKVTIESTTQGFLPPRMTTTQKNAIATPAVGLVVYDTTLGKLCVRGAAAWETITSI